MRKQTWAVLVALALVAGPASALEPGDLVIGVDTALYSVDPETGEPELLSAGPEQGVITGIAMRADGVIFFTQTQESRFPTTVSLWRFDPATGERRELLRLGLLVAGLAIDGAGTLVAPVQDRLQ